MNSKQTDNNEQKKTVPENWSPVSSVGGKAKPVTPTNENLETEFQKMLADGVIGNTASNCIAVNGKANSVETEDSITTEDRTNVTDSLQTEARPLTVPKRMSGKQRRESLEEYRGTFLTVPRLEDRKPVFISREVRDKLDEIARKLGGRRMSVSGFIENLARHHLDIYNDDVEMWKKL